MIRRPPRSTPLYSSAASDVYKRQAEGFYNTQADAESAIGGIYGKMTETFSGYYKWTHSVWSDMRADNTHAGFVADFINAQLHISRCLLYTSPSPRD